MDLVISLDGTGEKTVRVYRALREAIVDGRLPAGHGCPRPGCWPPTSGVARNSVATAYERLVAEGYLSSRVGVGHLRRGGAVPAGAAAPAAGRSAAAAGRLDLAPMPVSADGDAAAVRLPHRHPGRRSCSRSTPGGGWSRPRCGCGRTARAPTREPAGHPALRAAIARYLGVSRVGPGDRGRRAGHQRHPARARPDRPGAAAARATWWPSRSRATRRPGGCSRRSAPGWSACRWTAQGLVVDALPAARPAGLRDAVAPVPARPAR